MILHPGILALIVGSTIVLALMLYAGRVALRVLTHWDFSSSSERQLELEQQTYLVSTIAAYALGFEIVSGLLFLYTADDIHELFVGAMCATGSLNANPVGWALLAVKLLVILLAPIWIAFNHLDQRAGDYPIIRATSLGLLLLIPLVAADLVLQIRYFAGLDPEIITSCCGALFSESGSGVAGELASLPAMPMLWMFYLGIGLFLALGLACRMSRSGVLRYALSATSVGVLAVALASVVSFLSLYVYQLPTHHCPFDMLQRGYSFIGYPMYASLFAAAVFGVLPGLVRPFREVPSLSRMIAATEKRWLTLAVASMAVFAGIASWPVMFGELSMRGY